MASFVVETYVPAEERDRFVVAADGLRAAADGLRAAAEGLVFTDGTVHSVHSFIVPGDEMGFHVIEADSAEDVMRVAKLAGIEVERIVEAIDLVTQRR